MPAYYRAKDDVTTRFFIIYLEGLINPHPDQQMSTGNTSLAKMLALLDAFTKERHVWTVEAMAIHFGYTHSSTYRYVRELCRSGLLVRMPSGEYVIGARVVELESLIRETSSIARITTPVLEQFTQLLGCHALLSNAYGQHLINVVHIRGHEAIDLAFVRGRRLPWFRGAPSKAILAFLPRKRVRKLFEGYFEGEKSKKNWRQTLVGLKAISDQGFCISEDELQQGAMGIGAPIIVASEVLGSITLVFSTRHGKLLNRSEVGELLLQGCAQCVDRLEDAPAPGDKDL